MEKPEKTLQQVDAEQAEAELEEEMEDWATRLDQNVSIMVEAINLMATQSCILNSHLEKIEITLMRIARKPTEH
jgi:hypothetical protein